MRLQSCSKVKRLLSGDYIVRRQRLDKQHQRLLMWPLENMKKKKNQTE